MAFMSELFFRRQSLCSCDKLNQRLLLVRPLLNFRKQDLYKICQNSGQQWVEDPSNQNLVFARNRIRKLLSSAPFSSLKQSLQLFIAECRKARAFLDESRDKLLSDSVLVDQEYGSATVRVEKFLLSSFDEVILCRALAAVLQFIAQRERPPRGRVLKAVLNWIRFGRLKGAFTAAGCYLVAEPRSKASSVLIAFSPDSPLPTCHRSVKDFTSECVSLKSSGTSFNATMDGFSIDPAESIAKFSRSIEIADWLRTAKTSSFISEDAVYLLSLLSSNLSQDLEHPLCRSKVSKDCQSKIHEKRSSLTSSEVKKTHILTPNSCKFFLDRFEVSWLKSGSAALTDSKPCILPFTFNERQLQSDTEGFPTEASSEGCKFWANNSYAEIRCFEDKDVSYLSDVAKGLVNVGSMVGCPKWNPGDTGEAMVHNNHLCTPYNSGNILQCSVKRKITKDETHPCTLSESASLDGKLVSITTARETMVASPKMESCEEYMILRAKEALSLIKFVPRPVMRGLPVIVNSCGVLLAIPGIRFRCCPFQHFSAKFSPRLPLGGGLSSWV